MSNAYEDAAEAAFALLQREGLAATPRRSAARAPAGAASASASPARAPSVSSALGVPASSPSGPGGVGAVVSPGDLPLLAAQLAPHLARALHPELEGVVRGVLREFR